LNKYKKNKRASEPSSASNPMKHPQNIDGGRSKKAVKKYVKKNKRPLRDESMYVRTKFDPN
jgi:hypothetical protein